MPSEPAMPDQQAGPAVTTPASRHSTNFIYNAIGTGTPVLISLVSVPLYIHLIGLSRYGVITICWVLLGYFGFLDFGLSRASANAMARIDPGDSRERSLVFTTTLYTNIGLGIAGGLAMYLIGEELLTHLVKIDGPLLAETRTAYPWMAAMLPLGMVGGVMTGALESRENFLASNLLGISGSVMGQMLPLIGAWLIGPSLGTIIPLILLSRLGFVLLSLAAVARLCGPIQPLRFSTVWLRRLFGYGSWVSISTFLNPILDTVNQLAVGAMLGAAAVARYSIPMTLAVRSQIVATALARTLFPKLSRSSSEEARKTTQAATGALAYGFATVCGPAILFAGTFLDLWVGHRLGPDSATVARIVLFGAWTNGIGFIPYNHLQAQGRPKVTAIVGLIEILPFLAVLWVLTSLLGLPGAALAWTARVTINALVLLWLSDCLDRSARKWLPALTMMMLCEIVALTVPMNGLASLLVSGLTAAAMLAVATTLDPLIARIAGRRARQMLAPIMRRMAGGRNGQTPHAPLDKGAP